MATIAPAIGTRRTMALRRDTTTPQSLSPSKAASPQRHVAQTLGYQPLSVLNLVLGDKEIRPAYRSCYREELVTGEPVERMYVCERCFKYTKEVVLYTAHKRFCEFKDSIPGKLVYDEEKYSLYEVDGEEHQLFAQNLSLLCKLFIEVKTVCFAVADFNYYLLVLKPTPKATTNGTLTPKKASKSTPTKSSKSNTSRPDTSPITPAPKRRKPNPNAHLQEPQPAPEPQNNTPQIIGFFSKEKMSWNNENLACILIFPPWQRLGLGQLLMSASYELSRHDGVLGGPETPLSELGAKAYTAFWGARLARSILALPEKGPNHKSKRKVSVGQLSDRTFIAPKDIVATLKGMGCVSQDPRKRDGCLRLDRAALREWCRRRGVEVLESGEKAEDDVYVTGLKGEFCNLTEDEWSSEEEDEEDEEMSDDDG